MGEGGLLIGQCQHVRGVDASDLSRASDRVGEPPRNPRFAENYDLFEVVRVIGLEDSALDRPVPAASKAAAKAAIAILCLVISFPPAQRRSSAPFTGDVLPRLEEAPLLFQFTSAELKVYEGFNPALNPQSEIQNVP